MTIKKPKQLYLDVTKPNTNDKYYLINMKNKLVGEVNSEDYTNHPGDFLNDEITPIRYTGWRKKKTNKSKTKRKKGCDCKK
jgi:hypothetical protein